MCDTCGCSQPDEAVTFRRPGDPEPDHHHHHDHDHPHTHDHDHPHTHDHDHAHTVKVEQDILSANNLLAERNRGWFEAREILALNLVSSPGSGKTTLLERTITDLKDELPITVIEGDQQTLNDAERIAATGAQVLQVNTGQGCHLDAPMIRKATRELDPPQGSLLMIENVGNLVCPALFDLGEAAKVVIISVTEGDDKPLKYPHMFAASTLCVINKMDLLPHVNFDVEKCEAAARQVNHHLEFVRVSATTGEGMNDLYQWLRDRRQN
jgi:hydrogenase nickel incorporation protein HypB